MLCRRPYIRVRDGLSYKVRLYRPDIDKTEGLPFPCGQCLACRINKRRQWTLRLLLEYLEHDKAAFVTLTYAPENLPFSERSLESGQGVLCKRDVQLFLKRLRKHFSGRLIRYYLAGEYGPNNTHRPHYHLILFGVSAEELDSDWFYFAGKSGPLRQNYIRDTLLYQLWNRFGTVHVGEVTSDSISYTAGYVTSKIVKKDDPDGRTPEFSLMSRMPGLGLSAIAEISRYLQTVSSNHSLSPDTREILVEGKRWPVGRFLLSKLRIVSDVSDGLEEYLADCSALYRDSQQQGVDFLAYLCAKDDQRFRNLEKREKLFKTRLDL